jgi:hypothetical protein
MDAMMAGVRERAMRIRVATRALFFGSRGRSIVGWLVVLGVLAAFHGKALLRNMQNSTKPFWVFDDAQAQIYPFFKYLESSASAFANDYVADYYLACFPMGYWGLYAGAARLGIDPTALSRYLPHVLWFVAVICLGATANRLGGKLAAFTAMALALGSNVYLFRMGGGLPRSFGFPILAALLFSLAYGRVWWCAACVVVGALFYPVCAVISGLALAGLVLFGKIFDTRASTWSFSRRFAFLAGTAALAIVLLLPSAISSSRFGQLVRPASIREFPEAGAGGRFDPDSRPPFKGFLASVPKAVDEALHSGSGWSQTARGWFKHGRRRTAAYGTLKAGLFVVVLLGGAGLLVRRSAARRVLLLGAASGVGYTLARTVAPYAYLPERYVAYSVALLTALLLSTCFAGLFPPAFDGRPLRSVKTLLFGAYVAVLLFLLGGRVPSRIGGSIDLRKQKPLFDYIAALPSDTFVAGWPKGTMNRVPYAARRPALVTLETHQAYHDAYMLEMRRRMRALVDAYLATSVEPILSLRDEFGVTHLVVERAHFGTRPPTYFRPFDRWIAERRVQARGKEFELPKRLREARVFSNGHTVLLDLSRIESPGRARPPSAGSRPHLTQ